MYDKSKDMYIPNSITNRSVYDTILNCITNGSMYDIIILQIVLQIKVWIPYNNPNYMAYQSMYGIPNGKTNQNIWQYKLYDESKHEWPLAFQIVWHIKACMTYMVFQSVW